ncbi:carbon-nitrogen hydrolase [Hyaloscypha variabilis F]|uniref:Carbon-nitrogen hydrolase n=1 Tax=Hyaloscypha variabilis (strain UAMH 11265 / GT02V1 / F) TaxID=1149755 RepID=A0A2J6QVV9_HYAVF|nr:carbon-nitrogen hydrolase [Hyaloscypha variabilis F]
MASRFLAAACHISPITLSAVKTTEKCISFVNRAAKNAADLVVFPESYIPAFPVWSALQAPTHNHGFFERMAKESIYIDGDEMHAIRDAAKQTRTVVSVGISEKVRYSTATMFNSNIIIGSDGEILVHHRKLMPTFFEKLTWAPGDGFGLRVANTKFGKIGALICGENTNPLARYALMAQGEQVHISTWPAIWPTARYDNPAANRNRAVAHCFENKCFGILCAGLLDEASIEEMCSMTDKKGYLESGLRDSSQASTLFLGPTGAATLPSYIVDPVSEEKTEMRYLCKEEDILYAELDLEKCVEGKQYHDVVGGYQRLDVFDLKVDRTRRKPATFTRKSSTRS